MDDSLRQDVEDMRKVEVHVHLDGSVSAGWVLERWREKGKEVLLPTHYQHGEEIKYERQKDRIISSPEELAAYWGNWTDYSIPDRFGTVTGLMQTPDDLQAIAAAHVRELAQQKVVYVETRFAPQYHTFQGLSMEEAIDSVLKGLALGEEQAQEGQSIKAKLIVCIGREAEPEMGVKVARAALAYQDKGVVALDLACYEPPFPPERHKRAFELTFDSCLKRTVHAGEMMDSDGDNLKNMYVALKDLRADGLGHAIPLHKDPNMMDYVYERRVRIESNPVSNKFLGFIEHHRDLRLEKLLEHGVLVTVNSDDPAMWPKGSLADNLYAVAELYGIDVVKQVTINGILSAFGLDDDQKREYLKKMRD